MQAAIGVPKPHKCMLLGSQLQHKVLLLKRAQMYYVTVVCLSAQETRLYDMYHGYARDILRLKVHSIGNLADT